MAFLANLATFWMVHQGLPFAPAMHCSPASVCDADVAFFLSAVCLV